MYKNLLINKLNSKSAEIAIIGIGYVGLQLSLMFSESGYKVIGIDNDENKIKKLNLGHSFLNHITNERISRANKKGALFTSDYDLSKADALILCLPTPISKNKNPDLSFLLSGVGAVKKSLRPGQVVAIESTTYPGTTREIIVPILEKTKLKLGEEIFVIYSPEREDPGNSKFKSHQIPKIISGYSYQCSEVAESLYKTVFESLVPVSSIDTAELTKLHENIFRSVNIAFVNEMKFIADKLGVDIFEVINAASTKPFGFTAFWPGPGLGGHCIPIDPYYLSWKMKEFNVESKFIELSGNINSMMPNFVNSKIVLALNSKKMAVNGSKILILGVSYKKNIEDTRETPALPIIRELLESGAKVDYCDPFVSSFSVTESGLDIMKSLSINSLKIETYDVVVILTNHDIFNYEDILSRSKLIVDTRGVFRKLDSKVFRA